MGQLSKISEFARLSGISRKNLIYYHEIGLLCPEKVLENGYRLYAYRQLETVSVIGALQEIGMSLREIKRHLDQRTPETLLALFAVQRGSVDEKILQLQRIRAMIDTRLRITRQGLDVDPAGLTVETWARAPLFVSEEVVGTSPREVEAAVTLFYDLCDREQIVFGYPFGTMISRDRLEGGSWGAPSRFFFRVPPEGRGSSLVFQPAGRYLVGYECAPGDGPREVYSRMFAYMKTHGLSVVGNAYEEYLLDEIAVKETDGHLLQVAIQVE